MPPKRTRTANSALKEPEKTNEEAKITKKVTEEVPSGEPVKKQARGKAQKVTEDVPSDEPVKKQVRSKNQKVTEEVPSDEPVKKPSRSKNQKVTEEVPSDEPVQKQVRSKNQKVQKGEPENLMTKRKPAKKEEAKGEEKKPVEKPKAKGKKAAAVGKSDEKAGKGKQPAAAKEAGSGGLLNTTDTKWEEIDFGCKKTSASGKSYNLKITSWNVDGLRAWFKKGGWNIMNYDKPDIFCLQETKCSEDKLPEEMLDIDGYHIYWCSGTKEGYAGVGVYTKIEPASVKYGIGNKQHDEEGRCLTLEFKKFFLVNVYVPNAGRGLVTLPKRLEWNEAFQAYITKLDKAKPVIICGDMNVAHEEIDIANPKSNKKNAGFTQEEREGMTDFLSCGFVDTFRELYPEEKDAYTFWSYMSKARSKNIGWRLDYFITSNRLMNNICDSVVRDLAYGSDHCPITLFIEI